MEKISTLPPKTQQEVKSLYDQILEKGEAKGEQRRKISTIWNGWKIGVDAMVIASLLSCTTDEVQAWYKRFDAGEQPEL